MGLNRKLGQQPMSLSFFELDWFLILYLMPIMLTR